MQPDRAGQPNPVPALLAGLRRALGGADSWVLLGGGGLLSALALIAIFLPRVIAWPLAFIAIWFALGFLTHALKLWRSGHDSTGEKL